MKKLLIYLSTKPLWGFTLILMLALTGGGNFAWGDELTLTGTYTNTYTPNIPIDGTILNDGEFLQENEFIISSSKLSDMRGKRITQMVFKLNSATTTWGDAEFKIFLKEVEASTYASASLVIVKK